MDWTSYITEHALVLIPALMVVGQIFKNIKVIPDRFIPLLLLPIGILGAILTMGLSAESVIQGILVCGTAVYGDQLVKQLFEKKE